jgi:hypothetical protein
MITKYALYDKVKKSYIEFMATANEDAYESVGVSFSLWNGEDQIWLANTYERADYVRKHSTEWYNADYNTPEHKLNANDIEIRKVVFE